MKTAIIYTENYWSPEFVIFFLLGKELCLCRGGRRDSTINFAKNALREGSFKKVSVEEAMEIACAIDARGVKNYDPEGGVRKEGQALRILLDFLGEL